MKRINILRNLMLGLMVAACASCSDFFEPENDATLRGKIIWVKAVNSIPAFGDSDKGTGYR